MLPEPPRDPPRPEPVTDPASAAETADGLDPTPAADMRRRRRVLARLGVMSSVVALTAAACTSFPAFDRVPAGPGMREPSGFDTPLPIPPLAESRIEDGVRVFSLTAQEGSMRFLDGITTQTWGFDGDYLGPTLRAQRGEKVAVEIRNRLPETTTVHWHGMHLPAAMDGGPHQPIGPGEAWRPEWVIDQPAATLWYHPHPHGETEKHVYRGLSGMFLLDDETTGRYALPSRYGIDDIPVIVQDKRFDDDGQLTVDSQGNEVGLLGDVVLTNGTWGAVQEVTTELVRLRLLNGSTARTYDFAFDDDRPFALIAGDGGLLEAPYETDHVRLSPGERAEIVVRVQPGSETMLRSVPPDLGAVAAPAAYGGADTFDVLRLRAAATLEPSPALAERFAPLDRLDEAEAKVIRRFDVQNRDINGRRMDIDRIDEVVQVDTTEIWEVRNLDLFPHNWHVHDVQFEVLEIDGQAPPPELSGRKDTVYLEPRRDYRLIMRFEDYADDDSPYMVHCHLLLHEDEGLMAQFVVSERRASRDDAPRPADESSDGHGH